MASQGIEEEKLMNEVLKKIISHIELPVDQLQEQDPEIREIFIEEVQEIIEFLDEALPQWSESPLEQKLLADIRRSFHTLKGSGRMAGALQSGEVAWSIEEILNRVVSGTLDVNLDIQELVYSVVELYKILANDFVNGHSHTIELRPWIAAAQRLRDEQDVEQELRYTINYYKDKSIPTTDDLVVTTEEINTIDNVEEQTLEIFLEESSEHLNIITQFLHSEDEPNSEQFNQLIRAIHTIRGSSGMVGFDDLFSASSHVENVFKYIDQENYAEKTVEQGLLSDYYDYVAAFTSILQSGSDRKVLEEMSQQFNTIWVAYESESGGLDITSGSQGIVTHLLSLDINDLLDAELDFVIQLQNNGDSYVHVLKEQVSVLIEHTHLKQAITLNKISSKLSDTYDVLLANQEVIHNIEILEDIQNLHAQLVKAFDGLAAGQTLNFDGAIEQEFADIIDEIKSYIPSITDQTLVNDVAIDEQQALVLESLPANTDFDSELLSIFLEESDELVVGMDTDFTTWEQDLNNTQVLKNLFRYLHTLKGGANMVSATHLGMIAHELESIYERILNGVIKPDTQSMQLIRYAQDDIAVRLQKLKDHAIDEDNPILVAQLRTIVSGGSPVEISIDQVQPTLHIESLDEISLEELHVENALHAVNEIIEPVALELEEILPFKQEEIIREPEDIQSFSVESANTDFDSELLSIFLEESDELVVGMDTDFTTWEQDLNNTQVLKNLFRYLHTLKGGANMVSATHLGMIAHELESIYERILNGVIKPDTQSMQLIRYAQDDIAVRLQKLKDHAIDEDNPILVAQLRTIVSGGSPVEISIDQVQPTLQDKKVELDEVVEIVEAQVIHDEVIESIAISDLEEAVTPEVLDAIDTEVATETQSIPVILKKALESGDDAKIVIVESYLEEASELLTQGESLLEQWKVERNNRSILLTLQRAYHTIKGNSKLIDEQMIALMAYQLEVVFEQFTIHQFKSGRYDSLIRHAQTWLREAIYLNKFDGAEPLKARLQAINYEESLIPTDEVLSNTELVDFEIFEETSFVQGDGSTPPPMYAETENKQDQQAQEQIRISAGLVEKMIDLSGESAINRSRIEMDLGQMTNTLSEMELAIQRLADQLRRMEGELETQIIAKHEVEGKRYAEFDLLEMDEYSSLNQLSKSLAESASDLIDFKTTLADKIRDTENLLLQQSRLQNELQESLMGTRLVPFTRLVPRLQRLVRQTSTQLNRPVDFVIENTEGELDRNILERLVSPLEHMLRNAIDHGIEDQEARKQANKAETGKIVLNIAREGNDILVIFSDDGRGIDVAAVKSKAQQNGLIAADMQVSDVDVMQYIFHGGLSTAKQVSHISGRGVGLDVVQNEIKSLGGHVSVNSKLGQGTEFTIRVPTSVAISNALMVKVGDQQFALPLAQIERIVRVSPVALSEYYDSKNEFFTLDNNEYRLRYVGEFVTGHTKPTLTNLGSSVPVVIYNSGGRSVALQVDQLVGSRAQIVIKSIGKQLSSVGYVGGATILADGRVCLILDGQTIARRVLTTTRTHMVEQITQQVAESRVVRKKVMVVDDSVTVRKVTSRLLERHGYEVITAKDGVDAIEKLELVTPDLMLLDIEMPRMDGFEVANFVRHESQQRNLPIIMITSRTGEKHRERAFTIGVNDYMGKPFQEADLIENITKIFENTKVSS